MLRLALSDTLRTLRTPYFLSMLSLSAGVTFIVFVLLVMGTGALVTMTTLFSNPWGDVASDIVIVSSGIFIAWIVFPLIVPLIGIVFFENIANTIERREYAIGPIKELPFGGEVMHALKFAGVALGLNLLFLPVYFFVFVAPLVYFMLNGYLLGREYFELAGARHLGRKEAAVIRRHYRGIVWLSGASLLFLTLVPFVNLFAPFIGAAWMVHLFRRIAEKEALFSKTAGLIGSER